MSSTNTSSFTRIDFSKFSTKRLLRYFKSERQKSFKIFNEYGPHPQERIDYDKYISEIKEELSKREHIQK